MTKLRETKPVNLRVVKLNKIIMKYCPKSLPDQRKLVMMNSVEYRVTPNLRIGETNFGANQYNLLWSKSSVLARQLTS